MVEGLHCLCGPVVLGLFDKIAVKIGGLGQKEDLEARWLDGTVKMVAYQEIRGMIKILMI